MTGVPAAIFLLALIQREYVASSLTHGSDVVVAIDMGPGSAENDRLEQSWAARWPTTIAGEYE